MVIAVEPDPDNFAMLQINTEPYRDRCRVIQSAVWPNHQILRFKEQQAVGAEWARSIEVGGGDVNATTIPDLLAMTPCHRVSILKIDIEGAELELFAGDTSWLRYVDNIIIEVHSDEIRTQFVEAIRPYEFQISECGELTCCFGKNSL